MYMLVQYWVYAPFIFDVLQSFFTGVGVKGDNWHIYMFALVAARYTVQQVWNTVTRLHALVKNYEIHTYAVGFEQVDREYHS